MLTWPLAFIWVTILDTWAVQFYLKKDHHNINLNLFQCLSYCYNMTTSAVLEALDWLKESKYGYKFKDKIVLFLYILNATIVLIFTYAILGRDKAIEVYFHKSLLLNWMPFKSVVIEREGIKLSLSMIIDHIILVKSDWEKEERAFLGEFEFAKRQRPWFYYRYRCEYSFYTILFAKRYPNYKIISIEASKKIFEQLEQNCNLNNIDTSTITLINMATTDVDNKKVQFYQVESLSTISKEFLVDLPTYDKMKL